MNKNVEMELLLNNISELYKANSNTNYKDIYNYINKNNNEINLINIQSNFYQQKKEYEKRGITIIPYHDYLGIYLPDKDKYISKILEKQNNIKIYLSLEKNEIFEISAKIIEYMYKKRISSLYTIQNYYNTEVVSISFINNDDIETVINYLNKKIKTNNNINPFIFRDNNISIGLDGLIPYDIVLSKIIERYMKEIDSYDKVSINSFSNYIEDNILSLNKKKREYLITLYGLDSNEKYSDFIVLSTIIKDIICNELSLDKLQKYQKKMCSKKEKTFTNEEIINVNRLAVRELLDIMLEVYDNNPNINNSIEKLHESILCFIEKEDYNCLPEEKGIRSIIKEIITYDNFREYLISLGKEALLRVCLDTKTKYGDEQLKIALLEAEKTGDMSSFTNENGSRSELGIVLPKKLLKELVKRQNNEIKEI